jgi:hypothetical protein
MLAGWAACASRALSWKVSDDLLPVRLPHLARILLHTLLNPLGALASAAVEPYAGRDILSMPLTVGAGILLLVRRTRPGLAFFFLIVGLTGMAWALFGPMDRISRLYSPVFPVLSLAGAAVGAFVLLRAAASRDRAAPLERAALPLILTAAVALNVKLLQTDPAGTLAFVVGRLPLQTLGAAYASLPQKELLIAWRWSAALVGFPLVVVPALVVAEGMGLKAAVATLVRAFRREPVGMLFAYLGLAVLAALPLQSMVFGSFRGYPWTAMLVTSLITGATAGVFVYATTLVARAARRCVEGTL